MLVCYCRVCLPGKVVIGYSDRAADIWKPHEGHPYTIKNGLFPIGYKDWKNIFVEGDDTQTKANIVATFGDKFEE
jgi:hypothetical protein